MKPDAVPVSVPPWVSWRRVVHEGHQYRLALCGHKAAEMGVACLALMVQGHLLDLTAAHFLIAAKTGILAMFPTLGVTFTRAARFLTNRWAAAGILAASGVVADAVSHGSHFPGALTEAALTALGGALLAVIISYTPAGHRIDELAERFLARRTDAPPTRR